MNYAELRAAVLADAHRTNDASAAVRIPEFVARCEGMIARELRAREMLRASVLTETDRIEAGLYALPVDFLEDRLFSVGLGPLQKIGIEQINAHPINRSVWTKYYAMQSDAGLPQVEFRGVPAQDDTIDCWYYARPTPLTDDADTNVILTNHPTIYIEGTLFHLYKWTQDLELAQASADVFLDSVTSLNEQSGRYFGGSAPAVGYNLGNRRPAGGY
jgi:hypothetical protein